MRYTYDHCGNVLTNSGLGFVCRSSEGGLGQWYNPASWFAIPVPRRPRTATGTPPPQTAPRRLPPRPPSTWYQARGRKAATTFVSRKKTVTCVIDDYNDPLGEKVIGTATCRTRLSDERCCTLRFGRDYPKIRPTIL